MNYKTLVILLVLVILIISFSFLFINKEKFIDTGFPKRIFQTWKSKTDIPENMNKWSESWKKYHPDYLYELWDDEDNRNFLKTMDKKF